jgi:hypothetical protein
MEIQDFLSIFASVIIPMIAGGAWLWNRLDRRFEEMDKRYDQKFEVMDRKFDQVILELRNIDRRLTSLESKVEERTLKVIYTAKAFDEKALQ